jgi:nitroreductase
MGNTLDDLKNRRSVRSYKSEQIKDADLDAILEAGVYAGSGMGQQSVALVAVQDKETLAKIEALNAAVLNDPKQKPFYGAPTVVSVFADKGKITPVENGSLAAGNIMNAAAALGLGSCWIHRAKETFESAGGKEILKKWGLENYVAICHILIGYTEGPQPSAAPRLDGRIVKIK